MVSAQKAHFGILILLELTKRHRLFSFLWHLQAASSSNFLLFSLQAIMFERVSPPRRNLAKIGKLYPLYTMKFQINIILGNENI